MEILEIRSRAWNHALNAHGTFEVFARRQRRLRRRTQLRDFLGLLVPILVAFAATATWLDRYRDWALAALGVAGLAQFIVTVWSIIKRWDEELAYASRAVRDSYELKTAWIQIAENEVTNPELSYQITFEQQRIIDSHDIGKEFTLSEKRYGMRLALFERQRKCAVCEHVPKSPRMPRFVWNRCDACGGTMTRSLATAGGGDRRERNAAHQRIGEV